VPILNGLKLGIVGEVGAPKDFPVDRLKSVLQVVYPFPALTPDLLGLARWMARYYACGLDSIIETMIPGPVRGGAGIKQEKLLAIAQKLTPEELAVLEKRAPQQARLYRLLADQFRPLPKGFVLGRRRCGASSGTLTRTITRRVNWCRRCRMCSTTSSRRRWMSSRVTCRRGSSPCPCSWG
jgi:primosomal protein N' (replication factor Y)